MSTGNDVWIQLTDQPLALEDMDVYVARRNDRVTSIRAGIRRCRHADLSAVMAAHLLLEDGASDDHIYVERTDDVHVGTR